MTIGVTTPMVIERPRFNPWAKAFGVKLRVSIARSTASRFSSETRARPPTIRDTVLIDTPASSATSESVVCPRRSSGGGGEGAAVDMLICEVAFW